MVILPEDVRSLTNLEKIAEAGERFYRERYRATMEQRYLGQYCVIDVTTGEAYVGKYPEDALRAARSAAPAGVFHLVRIGSASAYRVSHLLHAVAR